MMGEYRRQLSCTDCLDNIDFDQRSFQYIHEKYSLIDRIYNDGLPLRDNKLLDKLNKRKAYYDSTRNEIWLATGATAEGIEAHYSEMDDGDKRHKHSGTQREIEQNERISKKPYFTAKDQQSNYQMCMSCSCSSKVKPYRNADVINNYGAKSVNRIDTSSSSRLYMKRKQGDRSRKMRAVHFKTKYIRSDPCTCTTNLSEVFSTRHSRRSSKISSKHAINVPTTIDKRRHMYVNVMLTNSKAIKSKRYICECPPMEYKKDRKSNASFQRIKNAKDKVKDSIRSSISKIENQFKIKKDSIMLFRDKLIQKRALKKYGCRPSFCITEDAGLPKCYEKIKTRLNEVKSDIKKSLHGSGISLRTQSKRGKSASKRKSKGKQIICTCKPGIDSIERTEESIYNAPKRSFLSKKIKQGDKSRKLRAVHFKSQDIRSDPCTCTANLSEIINKRHSRRKSKKLYIPTTTETKTKSKKHVCDCYISGKSKTSFRSIKNAKEKMKNSIKRSISKIENQFRIKKDSIMLFKDKLIRKRAMKKHECQPNYCEPVCAPPKCYEKIKMRLKDIKSDIKKSYHDLRVITSGISLKSRPKKEKSKRKRKPMTKQVTCTCEHDIESTLHDEESFKHIEEPKKSSTSKRKTVEEKDTCSCAKRNGLVIHIDPVAVMSKRKSAKPKSIQACTCDEAKPHKPSIRSTKSFKKTPRTYEFGQYTHHVEDRTSPRVCEASICIPDKYDHGTRTETHIQSHAQGTSDTNFAGKTKQTQLIDIKDHHVKSENIKPTRQVVRIGSNFSFNIEFYKEKVDAEKGDVVTQNRIQKQKPMDEQSVSSKTKYTCDKTCTQNKSSQSKEKRLTSVKTNYPLKRCFCNLQLKDATPEPEKSVLISKDKQIESKSIKPACDCEIKSTQTKKKRMTSTSLLASSGEPFEPYFDSNETCNPSTCDKRVGVRHNPNMSEIENKPKTHSRGTKLKSVGYELLPPPCAPATRDDFTCPYKRQHGVCKHKKIDTVGRFKSRSKSVKTLSDTGSSKRQMSRQTKTLKSLSSKDFAPYKKESSTHRQAVRIGSSFSFNIEFYKDTSSEKPTFDIPDIKRKDKNKYKKRKTKSVVIPLLKHEETTQINDVTDEPKESGIKPFFDKCFCSLKRLKGKKDTLRVSNQKTQCKIITIDMQSRPCQCEIKANTQQTTPEYRNVQQSTHEYKNTREKKVCTAPVSCKSTSSGTSKSYIKNQLRAEKSVQPESLVERKNPRNIESYANSYVTEEPVSNKQVVRIGSSFSFNIEFYKDKSDAFNEIQPVADEQRRKAIKLKHKRNEDRRISLRSQKQIRPKKGSNYKISDNENKDCSECSEPCPFKVNKVDHRGSNTPKTRNKTVSIQDSKRWPTNYLSEPCKCNKGIEARQKSYKHKISYDPGEDKIKSETIGTCTPIKCKFQKTQSKFYKKSVKNNVIIQPETTRNTLIEGQNKNGKNPNLGLMLKHCLCSLKYSKQSKGEKVRNNNEKETQLNAPYKRQCFMREQCVTANRKQLKAKSVLDMKLPSLKTKKVQSSFKEHEPSAQKYSDQNIIREKPRLKHRLQKNYTKKAVRLGSAFNFDIEFSRQYESPDYQDDNTTSIKKSIRYAKEKIDGDEISNKKIINKRICGPCFHRHREYQVGYVKEEVTAILGHCHTFQERYKFQQNMKMYHDHFVNTTQIINPVLIQSNPYKRNYTKSKLREGKKKTKWPKKHVRFAFSNIETMVKNAYSSKRFRERKRFMSEIYNNCFCDSSETLKSKKPLLRAQKKSIVSNYKNLNKHSPSRTSSRLPKMPKEHLSLPSKWKKDSRRKSFKSLRSKKRRRPTKFVQTEKSTDKTTSCKCNLSEINKTLQFLISDPQNPDFKNPLTTEKTIENQDSKKIDSANIIASKKISKYTMQSHFKRRRRKSIKGNSRKQHRIQQVYLMKNISKTKNPLKPPNNNKQRIKQGSFGRAGRNSELINQFYKAKADNSNTKKRSKIIRRIMRSTHTNKKIKTNIKACSNENCKANLEIIKAYNKRKFGKPNSRTSLSKECKLILEKKTYNMKAKLSEYADPMSKTKFNRKISRFHRISQRMKKKTSICDYICLKRARTNLLESKLSHRSKRATSIKQPLKEFKHRKERSIKHLGNMSAIKKILCVCRRLYSETDKSLQLVPNNNNKNTVTENTMQKLETAEANKGKSRPQTKLVMNVSNENKKRISHNKSTKQMTHLDTEKKTVQTQPCDNINVAVNNKKLTYGDKPTQETQQVESDKKALQPKVQRDTKLVFRKKNKTIEEKSAQKTEDKSAQKTADKSAQKTADKKVAGTIELFKNKIIQLLKIRDHFIKSTTTCHCGSKICEKNSKKKQSKVSKPICLCNHVCECSKRKKVKKAKKEKLKKKPKKSKEKRRKVKQKPRKKKMSTRENSKQIKKYQETPDSVLLAESCLDATKMSTSVIWGLVKAPYNVIKKPKKVLKNFKRFFDRDNPNRFTDRAVSIRQRCAAMRVTKCTKDKLESYTITNFLLHAFDNDPAKRLRTLKSKKPVRRKERIDFECSPFMASLRKHPYLWVYDKFPHFYPQFISLLGACRQFVDMMLFVLAIVVWSPCIFSIEMCRALICCCLCTG